MIDVLLLVTFRLKVAIAKVGVPPLTAELLVPSLDDDESVEDETVPSGTVTVVPCDLFDFGVKESIALHLIDEQSLNKPVKV